MYDHIGLRVEDIDRSTRFYEAALAPLGYGLRTRGDTGVGFGGAGNGEFWLHPAKGSAGTGAHIAFHAPDRPAVEGFYKNGLAAGGRDHGGPGLRAEYSPQYYAAFLLDPDGNNIEAVCMS
jgi:catechol 2,3-dioxygenase-like lactoylglutathione lyase family enzyme